MKQFQDDARSSSPEVPAKTKHRRANRSSDPTNTVLYQESRGKILTARARPGEPHRCDACGFVPLPFAVGTLECHHVRRVADGGTDDLDNLLLLCGNCHSLAHVLFSVQFVSRNRSYTQDEMLAALRDPEAFIASEIEFAHAIIENMGSQRPPPAP